MSSATTTERSAFWPGFFAALTARSLAWAAGGAIVVALLIAPSFVPPLPILFGRTLFIALVVLLAYTAAAQWRARTPPTWVVQLLAVGISGPLATLAVYLLSTGGSLSSIFTNEGRVTGLVVTSIAALIFGIVLALGALFRERNAQAEALALSFALERERLERQAADSQLAVLRSQIEPHFLFNTLANVQALVESGSPRAAPVLTSLIAYLRASMPRLGAAAPTLGEELSLVRAYLELMQLRIPDRLSFAFAVDPALNDLRLPPLTLHTLVENAVRHGIDPTEAGGSIEVGARREADGSALLWVADTGRGIDDTRTPGTGLANLRQRLAAVFGAEATLELHSIEPQGVRAQINLPAAR